MEGGEEEDTCNVGTDKYVVGPIFQAWMEGDTATAEVRAMIVGLVNFMMLDCWMILLLFDIVEVLLKVVQIKLN